MTKENELRDALEAVLKAIEFTGWSIDDSRWTEPLRRAKLALRKGEGER